MKKSKTFTPKQQDIKRNWYLVDAKGKVLGKLASKVAVYLQGKHKPDFTPYIDMGDEIIVVNADKIITTGKKLKQKMYQRYSGYPGGLKETPQSVMLERAPESVIKLAVKGMLPKNRLGRKMISKLRVYRKESHPHQAQNPTPLDI